MQGKAYTEEGLLKALIEQFGPDERFYTCSAENLTAQGLIDFLKGSYALFQGQKEIIISFRYYNSLFYCTSGFAEGTLARKYSNKFGISLAYSYLCTRWIYRVSSYHF